MEANSDYGQATYTIVYVYTINDAAHEGLFKVGKTTLKSSKSEKQLTPRCHDLEVAAKKRIDQQTRTALIKQECVYTELAERHIKLEDGTERVESFSDGDVHGVLKNSGFTPILFEDSGKESEWFKVSLKTVVKAITTYKQGLTIMDLSDLLDESQPYIPDKSIILRQEQKACINKTVKVFTSNSKKPKEMLWDCKMRFGKTATAYELIRQMEYSKVIVVTHRPAVEDSWEEDHRNIFYCTNHMFVQKTKDVYSYEYDEALDTANDKKLKDLIAQDIPFVYFASMQDLRGSEIVKGKYRKNIQVFKTDWDLVIVDEAHEGTQTDLGKAVINALVKPNSKIINMTGTAYMLRDMYEDENVFTWTYVDEQKAKLEWATIHPDEKNPYEDLPTMNIYTFDISDDINDSYRYVTEDSSFSFHEFFRTWTGDLKRDYRDIPEGHEIGDFVYESEVLSFLNLISTQDEKSYYPFATEEWMNINKHTFWLVPGVKEAKALVDMLRRHKFFSKYYIVNVAGDGDEEIPTALQTVKDAIKYHDKTITVSCGRFTTGITVPQWTGILMLFGSATTSASSYMQAIFRVQSPYKENGFRKDNCYVYDFAPDRALKVIADAHKIGPKGRISDDLYKEHLGEFLNFCPVISIKGTEMRKRSTNELMQQIKRISVQNAILNGFDDDSVYLVDAGLYRTDEDNALISKLGDVVLPRKKAKRETTYVLNDHGMDKEERKRAEEIDKKKRKQGPESLSDEDKEKLKKLEEAKENQRRLFNLLRQVSIRLPLLFYGVDADISQIIHIDDFVTMVDDESWAEFMPEGLSKAFFKEILRFYDKDVVEGAGLRIRKLAKAADGFTPTERMLKIVELISTFKNPDKETVLTPWRVVNLHMGDTLGGYNFFDENYIKKLPDPRFVENGEITSDLLLNPEAKILEINSKSGLYPLYMAYTMYSYWLTGHEHNQTLESLQGQWNQILDNNIFVLCKTKMAQSITIHTLAGYTKHNVHAIYLPKLLERMKVEDKFRRKLTNPETWGLQGDRMKFNAIVGNPPYQGDNHQQIYPYFYINAINISTSYVSLIFPVGWQQPKNSNNLNLMNTTKIKEDRQIVKIDNIHNAFPGISGVEWVNIVLWKKDYDNELDGDQYVYTNGVDPKQVHLQTEDTKADKPKEIVRLAELVIKRDDFVSIANITSKRKPYGLSTDFYDNPVKDKFAVDDVTTFRTKDSDLLIYAKSGAIYYLNGDKPLAKTGNLKTVESYKVLIGYAWGNMDEKAGLGGAFSDIIIASPHEICNETYLVSGCFKDYETAKKHAKYLMTKFTRALLYYNKTSQHSTTAWGAIPIQDYSEDWWDKSIAEIDEELFKKYEVPDDIADFVRKNIQTKTEANIVNFK